jgi:hypothetical protein
MRTKVLLPGLLLMMIAAASEAISLRPGATAGSQSGQVKSEPKIKIAGVYFFGYQADGLDVARIRDALPIHSGQELNPEEKIRPGIRAAVEKLTGRPPTDIAQVCCDEKGGQWFYIGLAGKSYKPTPYNPKPQGAQRLPTDAMKLEEEWTAAFQKAADKGDFDEDDSHGYALDHDPEARTKQLAIRDYTLKNETVVYGVLATSADVDHRRAAAQFLGYATQSQKQIDALVRASHDVDEFVRNNAVRALEVLAGSNDKLARMIPAIDFIDMLNSGTWTDRNKGSSILLTLSKSREPKLLAQLRARAMPGLIEIARWDRGHAMSLSILGRIAGMDEKSLAKMIHDDQTEEIIAAAQKAK